ncbi:MAG: glycine C-acetyltransferase [Candidatus Pacebacteria bacterium]|nr:glycine C-acetyltransferase [Candidatus Paceibacterota bacterium]MBP9716027.1 glycine C-acetyltransferase [Candidatus Paceibacterota bacterium]
MNKLLEKINTELENLKQLGKFKSEREIEGRQGAHVEIAGKDYIMFASNNYIGLANHPEILKASSVYQEKYGYGLSSVRFLSGTQTIHRDLEKKLAEFLGTEDAILYSTNFMSNLGFFATITNEPLGETTWRDAIYSDSLNHASIIDAFKLCKKENVDKRIYPHKDLKVLENMLVEDMDKGYRFKIIVTDGIFSMEGDCADLVGIKKLADKYDALIYVDDAHAVGVMGEDGSGTPSYTDTKGCIDIISGTFGKALGGAVGGYIASKKEIVELLRQKSRTYLFSNSVPPAVVGASIRALEILKENKNLISQAKENADYFRTKLKEAGMPILEGNHPIVPLMTHDANKNTNLSKALFERGVYATGLSFPVVPEGEARIRFQISALHTKEDLDKTIGIIKEEYKKL